MRASVLAVLLLARWAALAAAQEPPLENIAPAGVPPPRGAGEVERGRWLVQRIEAMLAARPPLAPAHLGIVVVDVDSGKVLFQRASEELFNVASNVKLVTVAAALAILGPEYRFRTTVFADGWDGKGATRDLYLRGGGDPSLDTAGLWALAREVRLAGIKRITGSLVIDAGFFDAAELPPAFEQKQEDAPFRAPVAAASLNYNAVAMRIQPAPQAGQPPLVVVDPSSEYFKLVNQAHTVGAGRTALAVTTRSVGRGLATQLEITVSGTIRRDAPAPEIVKKRVEHPTLYLGATFRAMLATQGIRVAGRTVRIAPVSPRARLIVVRESEPLHLLVRELSKYSNNFMAEMVLKTIGAEAGGPPGTWPKSVAAVKDYLARAGVAGPYRYDNGSGLYDSNRFSPAQLVQLVRRAAVDFRTGPDFIAALAIAGADGTVGHRMVGSAAERYVRVKTGTLRGVSCLTGVAGSPASGRELAFSVLANDIPDTPEAFRAIRSLQDELAHVLVLYLETRR